MSSTSPKIHSFADLNANYRFKISKYLKSWQLLQERSKTLFYKLDLTETPRITVSIKINNDLSVHVFASNHKVEDKHVQIFLNEDIVLGYWTQLRNLLSFFGSDAITSLNHSFDYYVSEALNNLYHCQENFSEKDSEHLKLNFLINQVSLLRCKVYSPNTIDVLFSIYLSSSTCYKEIQSLNCLTIPMESELLHLINQIKFKKGDYRNMS